MSYQRRYVTIDKKGRKHVAFRSMGALGGASDCGAGQVWYPNLVFAGIKGQCATPTQAQQYLSSGMATGNLNTTDDSASSGGGFNWGGAGQAAGGILSAVFGPKPAQPTVVQQGMSPTTMVVIGGAALLGLALIMRRKD